MRNICIKYQYLPCDTTWDFTKNVSQPIIMSSEAELIFYAKEKCQASRRIS